MGNNKGMMSSNTYEWETPLDLFDKLNAEFHFDLDPCATHENKKCLTFFTIDDDGLEQEWFGSVFMNPPYGNLIAKWIEKAFLESQKVSIRSVVCLLPARTDTRWFHDYCMLANEIRFIKGRLRFSGMDPAPFPSMIVIFKRCRNKILEVRTYGTD